MILPDTTDLKDIKICNLSFEEYTEKIKSFHGSVAPGMIAAGIMVDIAMKNFPEGEFFDVICETQLCLVDAVQLLTPCTVGNGRLKIHETGRFSLTLFNKKTGEGIRVFIDSEKIRKWDEIRSWFIHDRPKEKQNTPLLIKHLFEHGTEIMSTEKILVKDIYLANPLKRKDVHVVCPSCKEMYFKRFGDLCPVCQGIGPYKEKYSN